MRKKILKPCQFCSTEIDSGELKTHELNCPENPDNKDSVEDEDPVGESTDYQSMSIEDLMDDITETEEELKTLRKVLDERLSKRGLRFERKEI